MLLRHVCVQPSFGLHWCSCKCPLLSEVIWTREMIPRTKTPRFQCWKYPFFWCYWNIKYHPSLCFTSLGGILPHCDVSERSRPGMCTQQHRHCPLEKQDGAPILLSGNWNWEVGTTVPEEIKGVSRNWICETLALLSHGKAPFSSESKQSCI